MHLNWKGGRAAEGAALEKLYTRKGIAGSNPALSVFWDSKPTRALPEAERAKVAGFG